MSKDNISIKEGLERHFSSFYNQGDDWHFFLGVADYVDFVKEEKITNDLILDILKKRDEDFEKFQKLEQEALKELDSSKNTLLNIIRKNKLNYDSLNKELDELRGYDEGRIHSSRSVADALNDNLFDIAKNLSENGHLELLDMFIDNEREPKNIYGNFVFSKKLFLLMEEEEILDHKKKTELWNAWNALALAYIVIYKGSEELEKMNKDKSRFWEAFNFRGVIGEMQSIEKHSGHYGIFSNTTPTLVQFKKSEYQHYLTRIHNYLIDMLIRKAGNDTNNDIKQDDFRELDKIKNITVVYGNKRNNSRILINKKYTESFEIIESTSKNIKSLVNAIIDRTDILKNINDLEACKSYLNSNSGCRIYKNNSGKKIYSPTPIVGFKNSFVSKKELEILSNIKTEVITFTKFKKQLTQQKSRNRT